MGTVSGTVFVTGGTGFVGRHLVDLLLHDGNDVVLASVPGDPLLGDLPASVTSLALDILDADVVAGVFDRIRPAVVFHIAGLARGNDLRQLLNVNVVGTDNVLRAARAMATPPRVVIPGSAAEYGLLIEGQPARETTPLTPLSAYGVSKAAQTHTGLGYAWRGEVPVVVGRVFNITGPREPSSMLIGAIAEQIAAIESGERPPILRVGNLDPYRDYLDIRDAVRGLWLLYLEGRPGEVYNLCSGVSIQVRAVVDQLVGLSGVEIEILPDPERQRPSDIPYCAGDPERVQRDPSWRPERTLGSSLTDSLAWWRERHNLVG
jgi:GDP-4-dehydro-6-deoxy-D-mannose reductase